MEIVAVFFIVGLLLWWIIKSDLKETAFQKRMTEENAKRDALAEADYQEALKIYNRGQAFSARRERHLRLVQTQCADAQDGQGLLAIATVSRILGWGEYTMAEGQIGYDLMNSICHGDECYALGLIEHKNPFPAQISEGFYRTGDVIKWIDEELSINRRAEAESTAPHR